MLDISKYGHRTELAKQVNKSDKEITVLRGDGVRFKMNTSDHFYLTITNGSSREVVKVVGVRGDVLSVERGADNTIPLVLPKGSCAKVEWNPAQLCEYVSNCVQGHIKPVLSPQTVCFTCDTCVEVDEYGRIVKVNGSSKC